MKFNIGDKVIVNKKIVKSTTGYWFSDWEGVFIVSGENRSGLIEVENGDKILWFRPSQLILITSVTKPERGDTVELRLVGEFVVPDRLVPGSFGIKIGEGTEPIWFQNSKLPFITVTAKAKKKYSFEFGQKVKSGDTQGIIAKDYHNVGEDELIIITWFSEYENKMENWQTRWFAKEVQKILC